MANGRVVIEGRGNLVATAERLRSGEATASTQLVFPRKDLRGDAQHDALAMLANLRYLEAWALLGRDLVTIANRGDLPSGDGLADGTVVNVNGTLYVWFNGAWSPLSQGTGDPPATPSEAPIVSRQVGTNLINMAQYGQPPDYRAFWLEAGESTDGINFTPFAAMFGPTGGIVAHGDLNYGNWYRYRYRVQDLEGNFSPYSPTTVPVQPRQANEPRDDGLPSVDIAVNSITADLLQATLILSNSLVVSGTTPPTDAGQRVRLDPFNGLTLYNPTNVPLVQLPFVGDPYFAGRVQATALTVANTSGTSEFRGRTDLGDAAELVLTSAIPNPGLQASTSLSWDQTYMQFYSQGTGLHLDAPTTSVYSCHEYHSRISRADSATGNYEFSWYVRNASGYSRRPIAMCVNPARTEAYVLARQSSNEIYLMKFAFPFSTGSSYLYATAENRIKGDGTDLDTFGNYGSLGGMIHDGVNDLVIIGRDSTDTVFTAEYDPVTLANDGSPARNSGSTRLILQPAEFIVDVKYYIEGSATYWLLISNGTTARVAAISTARVVQSEKEFVAPGRDGLYVDGSTFYSANFQSQLRFTHTAITKDAANPTLWLKYAWLQTAAGEGANESAGSPAIGIPTPTRAKLSVQVPSLPSSGVNGHRLFGVRGTGSEPANAAFLYQADTVGTTTVLTAIGPGDGTKQPPQTVSQLGAATESAEIRSGAVGAFSVTGDGTGAWPYIQPPGAIVAYGGVSAPSGWLLCDGSTFSSVSYPALAGVLGDTFGTHSGTTYYLPDLRQRFPLGKAASGTGDTLGGTGGSIDHSHGSTGHSHTVSVSGSTTYNGGHTHDSHGTAQNTATSGTGAQRLNTPIFHSNPGDHNHSFSSSGGTGTGYESTGSNNPPFITLNYIIKF